MLEEQVKKLIQENLENCWRQFARTKYLDAHTINTALCMNSGLQESLLNSVISFNPNPKKLLQETEQIESFYAQKYLPFCWWIPYSPLANQIDQILKAKKFTQTMEVKGMALDITKLSFDYSIPDNVRFVQANTPKDYIDWMNVLQDAFDMDDAGAERYRDMIEKLKEGDQPMECYIAYQDNQPVSSLTLFLDKKVASFYNVGTLHSHRGNGLTTTMALYCLDIARKKGYTWATLQANPNSVRLFSRMGFQSFIAYRLYFK